MKLKKKISTFKYKILQIIKLYTILETTTDCEYYKLQRRTNKKIKSTTIKRNQIKISNNRQNDTN